MTYVGVEFKGFNTIQIYKSLLEKIKRILWAFKKWYIFDESLTELELYVQYWLRCL